MTGDSAVTSINERSTYSLIFFRLGLVPSTRNLRKFVHPPAVSAITCALLTMGTAAKSKLESVLPTGIALRQGEARCGGGYARRSHARRAQQGSELSASLPCRIARRAWPKSS